MKHQLTVRRSGRQGTTSPLPAKNIKTQGEDCVYVCVNNENNIKTHKEKLPRMIFAGLVNIGPVVPEKKIFKICHPIYLSSALWCTKNFVYDMVAGLSVLPFFTERFFSILHITVDIIKWSHIRYCYAQEMQRSDYYCFHLCNQNRCGMWWKSIDYWKINEHINVWVSSFIVQLPMQVSPTILILVLGILKKMESYNSWVSYIIINDSEYLVLTKSWPELPPSTTSGAMYSMVPQNEYALWF